MQRVSDIMTQKVVTLTEETTLQQACQLFVQRKIHGAPVLDKAGRVVGVLSEKDIVRAIFLPGAGAAESKVARGAGEPGSLDPSLTTADSKIHLRTASVKVREIMTKGTLIAKPEDALESVAKLMAEKGISRLPIVDDGGKLVGILSLSDVIRSLGVVKMERIA